MFQTVCRIRPPHPAEEGVEDYGTCVTHVAKKPHQLTTTSPEDSERVHTFTFDHVFPPDSSSTDIFESLTIPIIDSVLEGVSCAILSYGQTGAGKTFTMEGTKDQPGLIPQCITRLFQRIRTEPREKLFWIQCSSICVSCEEVFDLLSNHSERKLAVREKIRKTRGEFYVVGLTKIVLSSQHQIERILNKIKTNRNQHANTLDYPFHCSSIFQIEVESVHFNRIKRSKLQLVEFSGSERPKKTRFGRRRQRELIKISFGLSAIGNVIMSLSSRQRQHIPYRDSKVTKLIMDALGGNCRTIFIGHISPGWKHYHETLSTLRYTCRASRIVNKPIINKIEEQDSLIMQYPKVEEKLKSEILKGEEEEEDVNELEKKKKRLRKMQSLIIRGGRCDFFRDIEERILFLRERKEMFIFSEEERRNLLVKFFERDYLKILFLN